ADVGDDRRPRLEREEGVEAGDPVGLGRRDGQAAAGVAERAGADPANPRLHRVQHGQQQVAPAAGGMAADGEVPVLLRPHRAHPARIGLAEHRVDRLALDRGRRLIMDPEVHYRAGSATWPGAASVWGRGSFSTRIALALNSAVPDFGSVASIVRMFVCTSSGKWNVMNASPGRSVGSIRTGAMTVPRREVIWTRSPSSTPSCSQSSGERSRLSERRSGDVKPLDCTPVLYESSRRPVVSR